MPVTIATMPDCPEDTIDRLAHEDHETLRRIFEYQFGIFWGRKDRPGLPNFARKDNGDYRDREVADQWRGMQLGFELAKGYADLFAISQEEIMATDADKISKSALNGDLRDAAQRAVALCGKLQNSLQRHPLVAVGELSYHYKIYGPKIPASRTLQGQPQVSIRSTAH